jgi:hypothetical protein
MPMKKSGLFRNKNAKATPYKDKGVTEVGKEAKTQSYKEYVQKMFGGGMTEPAMKKNKMMGGGMIGPHPQQGRPSGHGNSTRSKRSATTETKSSRQMTIKTN